MVTLAPPSPAPAAASPGPTIILRGSGLPETLRERVRSWTPKSHLGQIVRECFRWLPPDLAGELLDSISRTVVMESALSGAIIRADGRVVECGLLSQKVVTTAGVQWMVDAFQNLVELETMRFHGLGTGNTVAEAVSNIALENELTTAYQPDSTRATGNLAEGASANIFHTEGTNTLDVGAAIVEHGLFNVAGVGGAGQIMWDRSVFAVVNLAAGDSFLSRYDLTVNAGG